MKGSNAGIISTMSNPNPGRDGKIVTEQQQHPTAKKKTARVYDKIPCIYNIGSSEGKSDI